MLQIRNLTVTLVKDLRVLLDRFSLAVNDGDKAVVIGEEGDGKSTLIKAVAGEDCSSYADITGDVVTNNASIGYLRQEMSDKDKSLTVYGYCSAVDGFFGLSPSELADAAREVGLDSSLFYSEQTVGSLSGGERVKLQLARLLIEKPAILLLDEPSNDIDIDALNWLERFINGANVPVLFVSHDETLIENTANVIVHIEQLRHKTLSRATVTRSSYREYTERRTSALERQERLARGEKDAYDAKMERFRRIHDKVEHDQAAISRQDPHGGQLLKKKMKAVKSLERRFERESEGMTQLPDTEDAMFLDFDGNAVMPNGKTVIDFYLGELAAGGRVLARDVALRVTGAEKVCIVGKNGAGKTTLIKAIAEQLSRRTDIKAAYMPQNYDELLDFSLTPVGFLAPNGDKASVTRARTYLGSARYAPDEMNRPIAELSGGQKGKLFFIKMVLDGADVLILDEPTRNFSPLSNPTLRDMLKRFGGAVIAVSHDRKFIETVCDTVYELTEKGLAAKRTDSRIKI